MGDRVEAPSARSVALLAWRATAGRDLPWRRTRDPWAILVSELMLQQTQVARVLPRYEAFLARFPDPTTCAAAPAGEVVRLWDGLGYNRRALHLHHCAEIVVHEHGGRLPDNLDALLALPGVGPYTARAVLTFAYERDVGVLDVNAARVLARWNGASLTRREAQDAADTAVPHGQGWAWNQAMLDLGATVCTATVPRCDGCPVSPCCAWFVAGCPEPDPVIGTAGVGGRQSRFEGSDRQGRGRLVAALRRAPMPAKDAPVAMGWGDDPARARRVIETLLVDGLVVCDADGELHLP